MSALDTLLARPDPAAVVREHGPDVYRRLKRIFGPRADVDDAYQNVFVEVLRSLPAFRGQARLSTWIRRIVWNVAYQEMRLQYRAASTTPLDLHPALAGAPLEADLEQRDSWRLLYVALRELDPRQRLVVVMHDVEGCTLKEIGEATGRPLPTVASQLAAGRGHLARNLSASAALCGESAPVTLEAESSSATLQGSKP